MPLVALSTNWHTCRCPICMPTGVSNLFLTFNSLVEESKEREGTREDKREGKEREDKREQKRTETKVSSAATATAATATAAAVVVVFT